MNKKDYILLFLGGLFSFIGMFLLNCQLIQGELGYTLETLYYVKSFVGIASILFGDFIFFKLGEKYE